MSKNARNETGSVYGRQIRMGDMLKRHTRSVCV